MNQSLQNLEKPFEHHNIFFNCFRYPSRANITFFTDDMLFGKNTITLTCMFHFINYIESYLKVNWCISSTFWFWIKLPTGLCFYIILLKRSSDVCGLCWSFRTLWYLSKFCSVKFGVICYIATKTFCCNCCSLSLSYIMNHYTITTKIFTKIFVALTKSSISLMPYKSSKSPRGNFWHVVFL